MYLLINLSEKDVVHLALFDETNYSEKKYRGQNRELLKCVDTFIKNYKLKIVNLGGIMCVVGSGGFTSTRIATVITNTLSFALQISVLAITIEQINNCQKLIPQLLKQPVSQYISPTYSGEPNIGKKKK
jgi:tRNA A37 threonylcarbamoyladenosine modification protein TsaB